MKKHAVKETVCVECGKVFERLSELNDHMKCTHVEKPAEKLNAIFMEWETDTDTVVLEEMDTLLNNLKRTVCQKNPVTDYTCDVCDKTFDIKTDFKEHVKIHNEKVLHM